MAHYELDTIPPQKWDGELADEETTRNEDSSRWLEIRVYDLDDGGWLSHRAGMSRIYHRPDTACRTQARRKPGVLTTAVRLPDTAEPCDQCLPPYLDELDDEALVRYEVPRHTVNRTETAQQMVEILTTARNRDTGQRTVKVSEPVSRLLGKLASHYQEFADVLLPAESVSPVFAQE